MRILALSPHTDDVELACGGYLARMKEEGHEIKVIAFSYCDGSLPDHLKGALLYEWKSAMTFMGVSHENYSYDVRRFSVHEQQILELMVVERKLFKPDVVLIPSASDIHQDHEVIHNAGVRAFSRRCSVLAYDLPWSCRGFKPDMFVKLRPKHIEHKIKTIQHYKSQVELNRAYFDEELIRGHARLRGLQINTEFAEAFETITNIA